MSTQIYVKGDQVRRVETPADRVAAEFAGFKLAEQPQAEDVADVAAPDAETEDSNALESDVDPDPFNFS